MDSEENKKELRRMKEEVRKMEEKIRVLEAGKKDNPAVQLAHTYDDPDVIERINQKLQLQHDQINNYHDQLLLLQHLLIQKNEKDKELLTNRSKSNDSIKPPSTLLLNTNSLSPIPPHPHSPNSPIHINLPLSSSPYASSPSSPTPRHRSDKRPKLSLVSSSTSPPSSPPPPSTTSHIPSISPSSDTVAELKQQLRVKDQRLRGLKEAYKQQEKVIEKMHIVMEELCVTKIEELKHKVDTMTNENRLLKQQLGLL